MTAQAAMFLAEASVAQCVGDVFAALLDCGGTAPLIRRAAEAFAGRLTGQELVAVAATGMAALH